MIPKSFRYKRVFKRRQIKFILSKKKQAPGALILLLSSPILMSSKTIQNLKLKTKSIFKKKFIKNKKLWFPMYSSIPLTKKVQGSRMGKGKGKFKIWYIKTKSWAPLCSYSYIRRGKLQLLVTKLSARVAAKLFLKQIYI